MRRGEEEGGQGGGVGWTEESLGGALWAGHGGSAGLAGLDRVTEKGGEGKVGFVTVIR